MEQERGAGQEPGEGTPEYLATWLMRLGVLAVSLALILSLYEVVSTKKTIWDWLDLIMVPVAVAIVAFLLNQAQKQRELDIARKQRALDSELAEQHNQNETLLEYLSQMANLLIDQGLLASDGDDTDSSARRLARARTLWTLWQVDANRKRNILEFLYDGGLVTRDSNLDDKGLVELHGANFIKANLRDLGLAGIALDGADLKEADFTNTSLRKANLNGADLAGAKLVRSDLGGALLINANLVDARLEEANLEGADLAGAHMPDGQKYEDWIKGDAQANRSPAKGNISTDRIEADHRR